jgi:D-glycero-alpha-D-manno-heptose 1-phosphate guanylyltransferase
MAPIAGRPFLELLLSSLAARGISRVILSVGYMADSIIAHFEKHPVPMDISYEIEATPLGTGGAIATALRNVSGDHVFVFNGDTYVDLEPRAVASMWPGDRSPVVVARSVVNTERFGRLEIADGRIRQFLGSGCKGAGVVNAGCYLIPTDIFERAAMPAQFSFETDFLATRPSLSLRVFVTEGQFIDIGVPADYRQAQKDLARLKD